VKQWQTQEGAGEKYITLEWKGDLRKKQNTIMRECLKCAILPFEACYIRTSSQNLVHKMVKKGDVLFLHIKSKQ
jgi:hypothetical protein